MTLGLPLAAVNGACNLRNKVREKFEMENTNTTQEAVVDTVCEVADVAQGGLKTFLSNPLGAACAGKKLVDKIRNSKDKHVQKRFWNIMKTFQDVKSHFDKICD